MHRGSVLLRKKKIGRGESNVQIYHIIRFRYPVFKKKKKNHKEYKETGKHDSFKKKKIN